MQKTSSQKRNKGATESGNIQKKTIQKMLKYPLGTKSSKLSKAQEDQRAQSKLKNTQQEIIVQSIQTGDQTPRFVNCVSHDVENGNLKEYAWDQEKIFVHECLRDDLLMLQNVFEGKIISALVYPLVFDCKSPQREVALRSVQFYKEVQNDHSLYHNLSADDKGYFLIGVRDLFIAACRDMLSQEEKEMLTDIVELIDPNDSIIVYKNINNTEIAPYPTATHKMVRFIKEEKPEGENNILEECFVRNELGLLIGFVDPRDLSFHNFENIINLDLLFKVGEDYSINNFQKHGDNEVYTFDLIDVNKTLLELDKCGLYTQPLNKLSRGGERFIFASRILATNLTNTLRNCVFEKSIKNNQFQFVNYVFRYNKFKPGDKKFTSHYDTPYHDPARRHYSKYTLLLYLTSGAADPVLSIDNGKMKIDNIAVNNGCVKGVIFDQKYEHEGRSFIDSDKIFLRSELVYLYSKKELSFDADVSRKFNIACYMTKQSVFNPELERYASECFNQVAQARLNLAKAELTKDVLIYKNYRGIPFITNGYDYWFLKSTCLKTAAIMTLLDYFGGRYVGFNMKQDGYGFLCSRNQIKGLEFEECSDNLDEIKDVKEIFKYLKDYAFPNKQINNEEKQENTSIEEEEEENDDDLAESLKSNFGEEEGKHNFDIAEIQEDLYKGCDEEERMCPFCDCVHPTEGEVEDFLEDNKADIKEGLRDAKNKFTVFIFNQEIKIEKSKIKINKDSIVFNEKIPTVNFASCQFDVSDLDIFSAQDINLAAYANVPPIPYKVHKEGYHLKIELFNNGFVRDKQFTFKKYTI